MLNDLSKYQFFPETYVEGVRWFRSAVQANGGFVRSFKLPNIEGPNGETLSTDIGWFGPTEAKKVFLSISGTHGQEYFSGAAGQLQWICKHAKSFKNNSIGICLVHCNNPYGAAYISRANENFVDLNRNYLSKFQDLRINPLVEELNKAIYTKDMNEHILDDAMCRLYEFIDKNDTSLALTAIGGGQISHPKSNLFCGYEQSWSIRNLKWVVDNMLISAQKVAIIDWHTGLGRYGELSMIHNFLVGSPEEKFAIDNWGFKNKTPGINDGDKPHSIGEIAPSMAVELRDKGKQVVECIAELGTVDNYSVLAALLIDRWLRIECKEPFSTEAIILRTKMLERLNPSCKSWRKAVLEKLDEAYLNTLKGLLNWD